MTPRTIAEDGFSLPELLVSMLFVVWFGAMLHQFSRAMLHSVRLQEERGWAQETVRVAVEVMTHELRLGGYSADGRPIAVLRTATADEVAIQSDLNGDGDTNDANEVISYRYDAGRQALMRATGAAPGESRR